MFTRSYVSMASKKSAIWSFFSVGDDTKYGVCGVCRQKVSIGGGSTTKTFNTSNLINHLKTNHKDEFKKYEEMKVASQNDADLEGKRLKLVNN